MPLSLGRWATSSLGRNFTLKRIRNLFLGFVLLLLMFGIGLRIEAALFVTRVHRILSEVSKIQPGVTRGSEIAAKIQGFRPISDSDQGLGIPNQCRPDKCLVLELTNARPFFWILERTNLLNQPRLYSALHWAGLRYWNFRTWVYLDEGVIRRHGYFLEVSHGSNLNPQVMFVLVSQVLHFDAYNLIATDDESPHYRVEHYFKWPELSTRIAFTPEVTSELKRHAFDLRLRCLWGIRGCRTIDQVLPDVDEDIQGIEQASLNRLRSDNQCPERILKRRARDAKSIIVVEVEALKEGPVCYAGRAHRFADLRLIRSLKGNWNGSLQNLGFAEELEGRYDPPVVNSAINLLKPGERMLLFSDASQFIDAPCEAMRATQSAVNSVDRTSARGGITKIILTYPLSLIIYLALTTNASCVCNRAR